MQPIVHQNDRSLSTPTLGYDAWRAAIHSYCGRFNPEGIEPKAFAGQVDPLSICGLAALDITCNTGRVERTQRDIRLDGNEHYYAVLQIAGHSTIAQNDAVTALRVGDVTLVDAARPVTFFCERRRTQWISLHLQRPSLVSHLGFQPQGGLVRRQSTLAARLLFEMARDVPADDGPTIGGSPIGGSTIGPADAYMHLAIYDLLGALFAPPDRGAASRHTDKIFDRLCRIIKSRFADPGLGPADVAAEAGISLRYLQKLFTARGSCCSHFIQSIRLDHAARLLHRLELLETKQPLCEIARAAGFDDYAYFCRRFRDRFGCSPSAHASGNRSRTTAPFEAIDWILRS
jgi:AraC family transcriptional regulator, positive regulator of tynA and feaB